MGGHQRRILLGVTADISISLMRGFPQYLAGRGWDVHVASSPGPLLDELDHEPGITTHRITMARQPAPLADLLALGRWVRLMLRLRPDVTSVGTPKAGLLGGLAAWLARVPVRVYLLRGLPLETSTGMKLRLLAMLERLSFGTAHTTLAVSPSLRDRVVEMGLVKASNIKVLGAGSSNGVDLERFVPGGPATSSDASLAEDLGLERGVPVIGFVGRLTEDKGLAHLAEAREILHGLGVDHQLLVVGGIDGAGAQDALARFARVGRAPVQTGHVRDTAPYYRMMDVLCLPTRREGFPNVVLEASGTGIPTVTTDATGAVDSVVDGTTGYVTAMESPSALAEGLAAVLENAEGRRAMGEAARQRVQDLYGQPHVWSLFEDFYAQSLDSCRDAPVAARAGKR